jgi:hypothetical protein
MESVSRNSRRLGFSVLLAGLFWALVATNVLASLGDGPKSVDADMAALKGQLSLPAESGLSQSAAYNVKQFVTARGTTVREYSAPAGPIFGVAWEGSRPPDLSVLLGSYYADYAKASSLRNHPGLHHQVIQGSGVTVVFRGHMGHVAGRAYVPNLTPPGVDPQAVVK